MDPVLGELVSARCADTSTVSTFSVWSSTGLTLPMRP
jgi:hypothetical protein